MLGADFQQGTKACRGRCALLSILFAVAGLIPTLLVAQPEWKTFSNRAGWSMNYPANWTVASCHSCSDPTAPDVYVDFFPPKNRETGFVMVEHLASQPSTMTVNQWLMELKRTANQNHQLAEESYMLNGMPALRVRYYNSSDRGHQMEAVYV